MFKIKTDREVWIPVHLNDPDGRATIKLKVRLITHAQNAQRKHDIIQDQVERLRAEAEAGGIETASAMLAKFVAISEALSPEAIAEDIGQLVSRVTDWQGVGGEDGEPLPFTPSDFRTLLDNGSWIVKAVREAITDLDDNGRAKN
ncbi:MAG: hypothetical protein KAY71_00500 [Chromatiaceae bacterium]|nr:hypothetical protein [Chromatiaceae bacterium]MBP8023872.1 hypothetical protein [Chromatiaceae bacterium]